MGMDDTCCDFVSLHARKELPLAQNLDDLIQGIDCHSRDYPSDAGSQLDAMRRAAERVQRLQGSEDQRAFQGALLWLLKLVDYVGINRVCGNEPDDAVDRWCADKLQQLERVSKDQCPECGAAEWLKRRQASFDGKPLIDRIRELPVGALLEMLDEHQSEVSEEDWEFLREVLCRILSYAASFYDDFDHRHYEFALAVAQSVLDEDPPEGVIQAMAGTAYFILSPVHEEAREFSAEIRACLERIRDTDSEFAELAADLKDAQPPEPQSFSIEAMLSDAALQARLVKWAVAFAHNMARPDVLEPAMHACRQVCAIWRQEIFPDVLAQLEADHKVAAE